MKSLFNLANKYNTDKRYEEHNYIQMYSEIMESSRTTVNKMLEIGFGKGGSVRMWMDYFPNADIYCMEYCDEEYKNVWHNPNLDIPNLEVIIGDSTKPESWLNVPYELDYIIDDGDHHPENQIATFMNGFSHVKSGGLYFIEDTHCNFEKIYTGGIDVIYRWAFEMIIQQQTPGRNYGGNFYSSRHAMPPIVNEIYSYFFYKSIIAFQKA